MAYTFQRTWFSARRVSGACAVLSSAALYGALSLTACTDDDDIMAAGPGSSGSGGGGMGGSGTDAGVSGSGGSSDAGPSGPSGTLTVLSAAPELRAPTTAAVRGNNLWVVNGQLSGLFGGAAPTLPFNVVSLPLTGGAIDSTVVVLPGDDFYPEGIAAAADGTLYVGSLNRGIVVKVPADSTTAMPFVAAGVAQRGVVGLTVDDNRDLLWFCDSKPGVAGATGAIVGVSLDDGTEVVRHAMPNPVGAGATDAGAPPDAGADSGVDAGDGTAPPAAGEVSTFCNDLILDPTGNLFATDSSGRIFRVPSAEVMTPNRASVWLSGDALGPPNGLDIVGNRLVIANGGLVAVDPNSNNPLATLKTISLTLDGAPVTLCGPDGLQTVPGSTTDLVVVENGSCNPNGDSDRVVRIQLDLD
jgi:sugar lactone lactonase YvrE